MKTVFKALVFVLATAALLAAPWRASAQSHDDPGRLWIQLTAGFPGGGGGGADIVINEKLSVRLAAEYLPKSLVEVSMNDVRIHEVGSLPATTVDVLARPSSFNGDITLDYVPFVNSSFHLSVGALCGNGTVVKAETAEALPAAYYNVGYVIHQGGSTYAVKTGDDNRFHADIRRKMPVAPYVALGFGCPADNQVVLMFDLGVGYDGGLGAYVGGTDIVTGETKKLCLRSEDIGRRADGSCLDEGWLDKIQDAWYFKMFPVARLSLLVKLF